MKKYLFSILAAAAVLFAGCNQTTPYEKGEPGAENPQGFYFPVASEVGLEIDPSANIKSHDVTIARKDASVAATVPFVVTVNTNDVFTIPSSVQFAAGEKEKVFKVEFSGTMEAGQTYGFKLQIDPSLINPYLIDTLADGSSLIPYYEFEATLIKYEDGEGVFVDDNIIAPLFGAPVPAWTVKYQVATLPSGLLKMRVLNPFNNMATAEDENGIPNGYPYNEDGDFDASGTYNIYMLIDPEAGEATVDNFQIGVDWGYGMMAVSNRGDGAVGVYDTEKGVITFDAADQTLLFLMGGEAYAYAGFRLYLSKDAYLADQEPSEPFEPVDAEISTYEGAYTLVAFDYFAEEEVTFDVTISSDEDEDGHYYVIEGIDNASPTFGLFDDETHQLQIIPNFYLPSYEEEGVVYDTYFIPATAQPSLVENSPILLEPDAEGNIVVSSNSAATGFAIYVENPDDEEDAGAIALYTEIYFEKKAAAEVSVKSMTKRHHDKHHHLLLKKDKFQIVKKK